MDEATNGETPCGEPREQRQGEADEAAERAFEEQQWAEAEQRQQEWERREKRVANMVDRSCREYEAMAGWEKVTSQAEWESTRAETMEDWRLGLRLIAMAGGERYLAPGRIALLLGLWDEYVDRYKPGGPAEYQAIAMALVAWYHFERVNELIGNLHAKVETSLFSPAGIEVHVQVKDGSPGHYHRHDAYAYAHLFLQELGQDALPLLDRLQRMMTRSLRLLRELRAMPPAEADTSADQTPIPLNRRRRA